MTLSAPSPAAHALIRNYGLLLLALNALILLLVVSAASAEDVAASQAGFMGELFGVRQVVRREVERFLGRMCAVLGAYHVGPLVRAARGAEGELRRKEGGVGEGRGAKGGKGSGGQKAVGSWGWGGPWVILGVHAVVMAALVWGWLVS